MELLHCVPPASNYVFIGEAGCGKSEIAVNLAMSKAGAGERVHLFDLDMTKPLFRSRELAKPLAEAGVELHFEEQFYDAPTAVGGLSRLLRQEECVILDVGGDAVGAAAIGGYAPLLRGADTAVFYVVNSFRPWSMSLEHIDGVLSLILGATHLELNRLRFVVNPNLGIHTTAENVREGLRRLEETLDGCVPLAFGCVWEQLSLPEEGLPLAPLHLYLTPPWEQDANCP